MNFVNLTPHAINIVDGVTFDPLTKHYVGESRVVREIPPSGTVARCTVAEKELGHLDGIPVVASQYGAVQCMDTDVLLNTSAAMWDYHPYEARAKEPVDFIVDDTGNILTRSYSEI